MQLGKKSVTLLAVRLKDIQQRESQVVNAVHSEEESAFQTSESKTKGYNSVNDIDLSGLTSQHQVMVKRMLEEKKESFLRSEDHIGSI